MNGLRGIATGILITTIILGLTFLAGNYERQPSNTENTNVKKVVTNEDVQAYAKANNLVILSQKEYDKLNGSKQKQPAKETTPKQEEKTDEEKVVQYTLVIKSGMSSEEVASNLESAKIIKSAKELTNYLEQHKLSESVKAGDHQVTNKMSIAEIATEITSY